MDNLQGIIQKLIEQEEGKYISILTSNNLATAHKKKESKKDLGKM